MGVAEYLETIEHPKDKEHKKKCKECIYHCSNGSGTRIMCQYILVEKKRRPCPANNCTVFVKGKQKKTTEAIFFSNHI